MRRSYIRTSAPRATRGKANLRRSPDAAGSGLPGPHSWQESVGCRPGLKVPANQGLRRHTACDSLFELTQRAARTAPISGYNSAARAAEPRQGLGAVRPARVRQVETRYAGAATGGGPDSPYSSNHHGVQPIPARSARGVSRRRHRKICAGVAGFRAPGRGAEDLTWLRRIQRGVPNELLRPATLLPSPRGWRRGSSRLVSRRPPRAP